MNKTPFILALMALLLATACRKSEGPGGTASLQGQVYMVLHPDDNFSLQADTIPAAKEDVFIKYGQDDYFGDDVETNESGLYQFRYLTPGTYTIFAYSQLPGGQRIAEKKVVSLQRGQQLTLDPIYIHSGKAYQTAMIKGWVRATYFDKNGNTVRTTWGYDQRVYLQRNGDDYFIDDTRVSADGTFYFQKLQPGSYVVYTFSQNADETPYPVADTVSVEAAGNIYTSDTLNIRIKA